METAQKRDLGVAVAVVGVVLVAVRQMNLNRRLATVEGEVHRAEQMRELESEVAG